MNEEVVLPACDNLDNYKFGIYIALYFYSTCYQQDNSTYYDC